jgi:succinate dehydrogenase / fumarate reductase cytochrome b subunit
MPISVERVEHVSTNESSFLNRHYFLIRRLHSLSGVVPIGVFLFPHLTTNSSIVWGRYLGPQTTGVDGGVATFQHEVSFIHNLPALILIEFGVLFIPILFHALVGIWFATTSRPNVARYAYQDNWRYTLQRVTGYIGIVYLFAHIMSLRFGWTFGGLMPTFDPNAASSSTALHFQSKSGALMAMFYLIGMLSLVFHFANGLWTAAITWGLTVSTAAQKRWGYVCAGIGFALASAGITAVIGFATLDIDRALMVEEALAAQAAHVKHVEGAVLTNAD